MDSWNINKSLDHYLVRDWGAGYFDIDPKGNVVVRPDRNGKAIDLYEVVCSLVQRGIDVPVLIRFDGILRDRVKFLCSAFDLAIKDLQYGGSYRPAFPIKVNQQRPVVDIIRSAGKENLLGLEVGSKPELLAVLAIHDTPGACLLCNGYKDREYIELALMARKLGRRSIIIIEQLSEIEHVLEISNRLGIEAELGLRMKPAQKGTGRWEASAGDKAKFGLSPREIVMAINKLKSNGISGWLKLLHYHIGSQITSIAAIKRVLREATRMYTEVAKLCPSLCFFDVGGGLGVDYDGSKTNFESSMNYSVEEYARDVVTAIRDACDEANIPHPDIVSESGRALVAHHSVLITQAIGVAPAAGIVPLLEEPPSEHEILEKLRTLYNEASIKNCLETLHEMISLKDEIVERFIQGDLNLVERGHAERVLWHLVAKLKHISVGLKYLPEDLEKLDDVLRDTYFCNFSLFQSLPDSWAIDQLFPIIPIHRLSEEPTRQAVLCDLTCDSDGKVDRFIDLKDVKGALKLHELNKGQPYYIGMFLVGAYQEILGDLHNLFGDTNAVHVDLDANGDVEIVHVVEGDTVREVLAYVQFESHDLQERLRQSIEKSLRAGTLTPEDSAKIQKRFKEALEGYTYLID